LLTPHFTISLSIISQNQLQEAELCVQDCHDCSDGVELAHEIAAADVAVDDAVACLVDLLDDSRANASKSSTALLQTEELVRRIKRLRADISKLKAQHQRSPLTEAKE
jgi:uncharacterized small protein (DUF1192 family)